MHSARVRIVLDFDGTVTESDLLDRIALEFGDPAVYQEVEDGLDAGTMPLREVITREFAPVTAPLLAGWEPLLAPVLARSLITSFVWMRFATTLLPLPGRARMQPAAPWRWRAGSARAADCAILFR